MITNDTWHNNELFAEGCIVEELNDSLVTYTANLKFELQRDDGVKNVLIGSSISLESENIWEKSISKPNKFCLDLFHAQQPTTDAKKQSSDFGKNSFLTSSKRIQ